MTPLVSMASREISNANILLQIGHAVNAALKETTISCCDALYALLKFQNSYQRKTKNHLLCEFVWDPIKSITESGDF